jgi:hypothetical protein
MARGQQQQANLALFSNQQPPGGIAAWHMPQKRRRTPQHTRNDET